MADGDGPVLNVDQNSDEDPNKNSNQNPNQNPYQNPNQVTNPPSFNHLLPNAPITPGAPQRPQLNWSHFKPKYVGKPDEDVEAHLLRMNDWMDPHKFPDLVKGQTFF